MRQEVSWENIGCHAMRCLKKLSNKWCTTSLLLSMHFWIRCFLTFVQKEGGSFLGSPPPPFFRSQSFGFFLRVYKRTCLSRKIALPIKCLPLPNQKLNIILMCVTSLMVPYRAVLSTSGSLGGPMFGSGSISPLHFIVEAV
jgi:hypothetical protein